MNLSDLAPDLFSRSSFSLCFQALHQLYYDPNIENKNLAQKWLMQAQISPQAWQFCWALLGPDKVRAACTTWIRSTPPVFSSILVVVVVFLFFPLSN